MSDESTLNRPGGLCVLDLCERAGNKDHTDLYYFLFVTTESLCVCVRVSPKICSDGNEVQRLKATKCPLFVCFLGKGSADAHEAGVDFRGDIGSICHTLHVAQTHTHTETGA